MFLLFLGLGILLAGGTAAVAIGKASAWANRLGTASAVTGCLLALVPVMETFAHGTAGAEVSLPWSIPVGGFAVRLDPLSAWFALPILVLSGLSAVFGSRYLQHFAERKSLGTPWFFYNVLVASMVLVVIARDGVLFLVAWEIMALSSYFLVVFEDEKAAVREAGRIYLIASHLGTAFLLVLFALLANAAGTTNFGQIAAWASGSGGFSSATASLLFVLAVVGFGTKAGFMPLHVWLPEAHPVAPSHVSAVMSGVMIKTGIYGLLRVLTFLGTPPVWWAWLLIGIGAGSGVLGILFALAQHDLKRLLAYSSVENMGIITLGLGVGVLGLALNVPVAAVLGFAGALLHVLNHALFKGSLFLGAGAVIHATGTGRLDQLGGLLKRMPLTAVAFVASSAAISGLPPFNGFLGEFLIYLGALEEEMLTGANGGIPALAIIGSLALTGGLALACFTKAFSIVFLGTPRTAAAERAHRPALALEAPLLVLAGGCLLVSLFALPVLKAAVPVVSTIAPAIGNLSETSAVVDHAAGTVWHVVVACVCVIVFSTGLATLRWMLLSGREVGATGTWDCGFAQPTARIQYTSTSFSEPILSFFRPLVRTRTRVAPPIGLFPVESSFQSEAADAALENGYRPVFRGVGWLLSKLTWIHHGHLHLYVLYIALTILALLVWYLGVAS
jgi:formate hydrogenlyase subunit 3/multisubunit Na+/H+ antiporter MnhD subunit